MSASNTHTISGMVRMENSVVSTYSALEYSASRS